MTVIHVAGTYDQRTYSQSCVRCGARLAWPDSWESDVCEWDAQHQLEVIVGRRTVTTEGRSFPTGALVEAGRYGLSMAIGPCDVPTCEVK